MDRLLARLERRIGRFAIPHLITWVVGGMAVVWALSLARPEVLSRLVLDMDEVRAGQVWRLVTFLFIPLEMSPWWVLIVLYFAWWVGSGLEEHWGAFKFNVYYFIGAIGTIVAAVIVGPVGNTWLDWSLFLAFATIFPDVEILLLFVLPIRVKWLGMLTGAWILYSFAIGDWATRAAIIAALGNYVLFFSAHWFAFARGRKIMAEQAVRRRQFESTASDAPVFGQRVCAICGAKEADGADIRVCSCEKCGGVPRTLCLAHARNH
jgi:hypothetical protein